MNERDPASSSRRTLLKQAGGVAVLSGFGGAALAAQPAGGGPAPKPATSTAAACAAPPPIWRRTEGRDEPILDPDLPIIDAHHHLFNRPPIRYLLDEYLEDVKSGHNIVASVYVETEAFKRIGGPVLERTLGEVEFANGIGAIGDSGVFGPCRVAAAIVSYADLRAGDAILPVLEKSIALAPDRLRGIRQLTNEYPTEAPYRFITNRPPRGLMKDPGFRIGLGHLARLGLSFDLAGFHQQMPEMAQLIDAFPNLTFILNHAGSAMAMDMDAAGQRAVFAEWRKNIKDLAKRPNIVCKVGGFGLPFWGFGFNERSGPVTYRDAAAAWGPYIDQSIEAFGTNRCLMESNYPPDARSCGFVPTWNALKYAVRGASAAEKAALFHDNAARIYRIAPPAARQT